MKRKKIEEHTPGYPQTEPEHVMTEEEALAFLRSPAGEFPPEELHAVGIVPADTAEPPVMRFEPLNSGFQPLRPAAEPSDKDGEDV